MEDFPSFTEIDLGSSLNKIILFNYDLFKRI